MKKIFFLFLIAIAFNCSGPQEPVFLRLDNIKLDKLSTREVTISAEALFHNPNSVGATLTATDIDIISNDIVIAKIAQQMETKLPAQAKFSVPLTFSTTPKELFEKDNKNLLGGVINALLDKSVKLEYKGDMKFKVAGISFKTPIDIVEDIKLKK